MVIAGQSIVWLCEMATNSLRSYSSQDGVFDERCIRLVGLCRVVIDSMRHGTVVEIADHVPQPFIKSVPVWLCPEVPSPCHVNYYKSGCTLGHLFRNIDMHELPNGIPSMSPGNITLLKDAISRALVPLVQSVLDTTPGGIQVKSVQEEDLHMWYASEI